MALDEVDLDVPEAVIAGDVLDVFDNLEFPVVLGIAALLVDAVEALPVSAVIEILGAVTWLTVEYGPRSNAPTVVSSGSDPGSEDLSILYFPHALFVTSLHSLRPYLIVSSYLASGLSLIHASQ